MRQLNKERREVWVSEYEGKKAVEDEQGRLTGEYAISYGKPFTVYPTLSPRSGNSWADAFGVGVNCDRTAIINEVGTGITDTCVLWVDRIPEVDDEGGLVINSDGTLKTPFDYRIEMVAESYNFTAVAMKKVL